MLTQPTFAIPYLPPGLEKPFFVLFVLCVVVVIDGKKVALISCVFIVHLKYDALASRKKNYTLLIQMCPPKTKKENHFFADVKPI